MDSTTLQKIIEGALLASGQSLTEQRLIELFDENERPDKEEVLAALQDLEADCKDRGYQLKKTASGYRFQVRQELAPWIGRLWEEKPKKYSRALLETLALIAYRQPITRGDIEQIRGVAVSSELIRTLSEREWVRVVGHRDVPGRPALYATTRQFLDYFGLKSLEELPPLDEIRDLDEMNVSLDLGDETRPDAAEDAITLPLEDGAEADRDGELMSDHASDSEADNVVSLHNSGSLPNE
jgi:segregation and condensation protein B